MSTPDPFGLSTLGFQSVDAGAIPTVNTSSSGGINWSQMLLSGVGAAIDSQVAMPYGLNNPIYNSQYGYGGQSQYPPGTRFDVYGNPIAASVSATASGNTTMLLVIGAVILFLVLRK